MSTKAPTQRDVLMNIATNEFTFHQSEEGEPFALHADGPRIPLLLRGSKQALRAALSHRCFEETMSPASASNLADVLLVCEHMASKAVPQPLHSRVARAGDSLYVDLGRPNRATCVEVTPAAWRVLESPPYDVMFRRTQLTAELPSPTRGDFERLRDFLNVTDDGWRLLAAWTVASLFPGIPCPLLAITGEQGSAKSTTAKMIVALTDPSTAPLKRAPRDEDEWLHIARSSRLVALDNLATIQAWLSDALCRASTGDGAVKRALYTDQDLVVYNFRRAVVLTGIAMNAVQGDLIDRLATVELERVPPERRKLDTVLAAEFEAARPAIFAGLLDLASAVLRRLPDVHLDGYPRMADYAAIVAALDEETGWGCLPVYLDATERAFEDAVDGNPVAAAIVDYMNGRQDWTVTAGEALALLTPERPPKGWPTQAHHFTADVRKAQTILRTAGIEFHKTRTRRGTVLTFLSQGKEEG